LEDERETKLHLLSYADFIFALKRRTFKGNPFIERIFEGFCDELDFNWK